VPEKVNQEDWRTLEFLQHCSGLETKTNQEAAGNKQSANFLQHRF